MKVETRFQRRKQMNLQKDDVLLTLDDHTLMDVEDLSTQLQKHAFGDTVQLTIKRGEYRAGSIGGFTGEGTKIE